MKNKGFTLIELVLVLVILAIVTNIAMVNMLDTAKEKKHKQAKQAFDEIAVAVVGSESGASKSFVGTIGRLPLSLSVQLEGTTDDEQRTAFAATELLSQGTLPSFTQIDVGANVAEQRSSDSAIFDSTMDSLVRIGVGWNGPYIKGSSAKANDAAVFLDAWGNIMSAPDEAMLMGRLLDVNSNAVVSAGVEVSGFVHFGEDARKDDLVEPTSPEQRDEAVLFNAYGELPVEIMLLSTSGAAIPGDTLVGGAAFVARLYLPCIDNNQAKVRVIEQDLATTPSSNLIQFNFSRVPVGSHPLVIKHQPSGRVWYQTVDITPLEYGQSLYMANRVKLTIPSTLVIQ